MYSDIQTSMGHWTECLFAALAIVANGRRDEGDGEDINIFSGQFVQQQPELNESLLLLLLRAASAGQACATPN